MHPHAFRVCPKCRGSGFTTPRYGQYSHEGGEGLTSSCLHCGYTETAPTADRRDRERAR